MAFHDDAVFDFTLAPGSRYRPGFRTEIISTNVGAEQRNQRFETVRHSGEVSLSLRSWAELQKVRDFFIARMGATYGFRFPDPSDYTSAVDGSSDPTAVDQYIGDGDGATVQFQLRKQYIQGLTVRNRLVKHPVEDSVLIAVNGTPTSNFTVDLQSGTVTMGAAVVNGLPVTAGFAYHNGVRFGTETDEGLDISFEEWQNGKIATVELIELIDERLLPEEMPALGARAELLTADITISISGGAYVDLTPVENGHNVFLPDLEGIDPGPAVLFIKNNSTSFSITLKTSGGNTIGVLAPTEFGIMHVSIITGSTVPFWAVSII